MGNLISYIQEYSARCEVTPMGNEEPTFDPLYGFENGRKERVMIASEDEMKANNIPLAQRDYCAHLLIRFLHCRRDNLPFVMMCGYQKHQYDACEYEEMKEFERERRLRMRRQRKEIKEQQQQVLVA